MNIIETINVQRKGKCIAEAQEKLQELVKKVLATGKKGKLTISLDIQQGADEGTVIIRDDVTVKLPTPDKSSSTFYADADGALHREDPKQREFPTVVEAAEAATN